MILMDTPISCSSLEEAYAYYASPTQPSLKEVGRAWQNRSHGQVWHAFTQAGLSLRKQGRKVGYVSVGSVASELRGQSELAERIAALYQAGESIPAIALSVTSSTGRPIARPYILQVLRDRGIPRRSVHLGGAVSESEAHQLVQMAVQLGILVRQPCQRVSPSTGEVCGRFGVDRYGRPRVVAHHRDYRYPLLIDWLCFRHHREWHMHNIPVVRTTEPECLQAYQAAYRQIAEAEWCRARGIPPSEFAKQYQRELEGNFTGGSECQSSKPAL